MTVSLLGLSGSTRRPSRTAAVVRAIVDAIALQLDVAPRLIELSDAAPSLLASLTRSGANSAAEAIIHSVETADILVVGTPVYRGSYTGALKHLFDLVHHDALAGKPVVLAATGGSAMHGLVTEHQLRPLMGFFRALSMPTTVYATEADVIEGMLTNGEVLRHVRRAAREVADVVAGGAKLRLGAPVRRQPVPESV